MNEKICRACSAVLNKNNIKILETANFKANICMDCYHRLALETARKSIKLKKIKKDGENKCYHK
jgi:ribosomal protein L40E